MCDSFLFSSQCNNNTKEDGQEAAPGGVIVGDSEAGEMVVVEEGKEVLDKMDHITINR